MIYSRVAPFYVSPLHPPHDRMAQAMRHLYAQSETSLHDENSERDLAWLGLLLWLAGGVLEIQLLYWWL